MLNLSDIIFLQTAPHTPPSPAHPPLKVRQQAKNDEIYFEFINIKQKKRGFVAMSSITVVGHAACNDRHVACECSNFNSAKCAAEH